LSQILQNSLKKTTCLTLLVTQSRENSGDFGSFEILSSKVPKKTVELKKSEAMRGNAKHASKEVYFAEKLVGLSSQLTNGFFLNFFLRNFMSRFESSSTHFFLRIFDEYVCDLLFPNWPDMRPNCPSNL
jgi:hypothetical protein